MAVSLFLSLRCFAAGQEARADAAPQDVRCGCRGESESGTLWINCFIDDVRKGFCDVLSLERHMLPVKFYRDCCLFLPNLGEADFAFLAVILRTFALK